MFAFGCSEQAHSAGQNAPTALDRHFDLLTTSALRNVYNLELKQSESCDIIECEHNSDLCYIRV